MKKILLGLTLILSFVGISNVKASDLPLSLSVNVDNFNEVKSAIGEDVLNNIINDLLSEYKDTYISSFPYYTIQISCLSSSSDFTYSGYFEVILYYSVSVPTYSWSCGESPSIGISSMWLSFKNYDGIIGRKYNIYDEGNYVFDSTYTSVTTTPSSIFAFDSISNPKTYYYNPLSYYISNYELYMPSINSVKSINTSGFIFNYDNLMIPTLSDLSIYNIVSYDRDDFLIEPYYLYDDGAEVALPQYTEINLNDYAYVALALKDYSQDAFTTTVQVKGQYCITPVYDHGLKTYDSVNSTKVQNICSPYYSNYTAINTTITKDNIDNYSIYYVKAYDTSKDNYIKIDNTVFDITYISEEEASNPYVYVDGKTYPTIAYDNLPSSATQNTEEGYVPGASEEFSFSDIFTAPLDFLIEIWSTITTFFTLITSFILLLPPILQNFLYASFTLAIVLGLIKIIL